MKTAADYACRVDVASDKPYARIEEVFEANQFASLTRRMMAEAARLKLDTDPIGDVFALLCGLFCVTFPFIRPDSAFDAASWRSFCQAELARYAELERRASATTVRMMASLDAEALKAPEEDAGRAKADDGEHRSAVAEDRRDDSLRGYRRGPIRLPRDEVMHRISLLREWASVQDDNKGKLRGERVEMLAFVRGRGVSVPEVRGYQAWYHYHVKKGRFPRDPRDLTDEAARKMFPKR
ncbi:MAG: hypothetical protein R6V05_04785 [Candidatus Brocadiia bacterium]